MKLHRNQEEEHCLRCGSCQKTGHGPAREVSANRYQVGTRGGRAEKEQLKGKWVLWELSQSLQPQIEAKHETDAETGMAPASIGGHLRLTRKKDKRKKHIWQTQQATA